MRKIYYKMTPRVRIKIIDNKITQNKGEYDLDKQTAKISASSSRYGNTYEFVTEKNVYLKKAC